MNKKFAVRLSSVSIEFQDSAPSSKILPKRSCSTSCFRNSILELFKES